MGHTINGERGRREVKREKRYPSSSGMIPKERSKNISPKASCKPFNNTCALNAATHVGTNPKKSDSAFIAVYTNCTTLIVCKCGKTFRGKNV